MDDLRRTLYVSAVLGGGGEPDGVEAAIRALAGQVRRADEGLELADRSSELAVDATFHVPGRLMRPDYEGVRTGRWISAKALLVVQVAVPDSLAEDDAENFLHERLVEAVDLATTHRAVRKASLSIEAARAVARAVSPAASGERS